MHAEPLGIPSSSRHTDAWRTSRLRGECSRADTNYLELIIADDGSDDGDAHLARGGSAIRAYECCCCSHSGNPAQGAQRGAVRGRRGRYLAFPLFR